MNGFAAHKTAAGGLSIALLALSGTVAAQDTDIERAADDQANWAELRDKYVSATELLDGDVGDGFTPIAQVDDLVLDASSNRVEYILAEAPWPYTAYNGREGFVLFEDADFRHRQIGGVDVVVEDRDAMQGPDEIGVTREEADRRLVTRVLGKEMRFGDEVRKVEDLLVDRETGEITHWVVEMDPDAILTSDLRAVPAGEIMLDEDGATASISVADAEGLSEVNRAFL